MKSFFRLNEYSVLFYRIGLAYLFYFIARILFYTYNYDILDVNSVTEFLQISYHGLVFDTTAILYVNGLFILLSTLPFFINTKPKYQKGLFYLYFISNLFFYAFNFVDLIYYRYNFARTTMAVVDILKNEKSLTFMFFRFLFTYWLVFFLITQVHT